MLIDIARSQPHAAFSWYIHGFESKWTHSTSHFFKDLDNFKFPSIPNRSDTCQQFTLAITELAYLGGIVEPSKVADYQYSNSIKATPLVSILTNKSSVSILEAHDAMWDVYHFNRTAVSDKFDIYKK